MYWLFPLPRPLHVVRSARSEYARHVSVEPSTIHQETLGRVPDVSVLVVTYNSDEHIDTCLSSIPDGAGSLEVETVVVDNCSHDESARVVRHHPTRPTLLEERTNHGFARAVNLAASRASGRYVLLVNPDARLHGEAIAELVRFADAHPANGIYGGRVLDPEGRLDPRSCWGLPTAWSMTCFGTGLSSVFRSSPIFDPTSLGSWQRDDVREVGAVSGCLLLVRRDVWHELGGLDESYFVYGEDIDLGWRSWQAGYRPVIIPSAVLTHVGSASSTSDLAQTRLLLTARATFIRLRWTGLRRAWGLTMLRSGVLLRSVAERLRRSPADAEPGRWTALEAEAAQWSKGFDRARVTAGPNPTSSRRRRRSAAS